MLFSSQLAAEAGVPALNATHVATVMARRKRDPGNMKSSPSYALS
jgi:hypothetical protein